MSTAAVQRPTSISFSTPQDSLRRAATKKSMSITQTYYLAHKARAKLSREAAQPDHDLRLLVGHANLLDNLMLELADAEREQERWFNQSVRTSNKQERHVQWASQIAEVPEEEYDDSDSSSEDEDDEDIYADDVVMTTTPAAANKVQRDHQDEDMEEDDLEDDYEQLELVRTPSHANSPPELVHEADSSDDESMPPSPPSVPVHIASTTTTVEKDDEHSDEEESLYEETYHYMSKRNTPATSMVSAITVY